eukprot:6532193-Prymnesium_polylepis.1
MQALLGQHDAAPPGPHLGVDRLRGRRELGGRAAADTYRDERAAVRWSLAGRRQGAPRRRARRRRLQGEGVAHPPAARRHARPAAAAGGRGQGGVCGARAGAHERILSRRVRRLVVRVDDAEPAARLDCARRRAAGAAAEGRLRALPALRAVVRGARHPVPARLPAARPAGDGQDVPRRRARRRAAPAHLLALAREWPPVGRHVRRGARVGGRAVRAAAGGRGRG